MNRIVFFIIAFNLYGITSFGQSIVTFKVDNLPRANDQKVGIRGNILPLSWGKSIQLVVQGISFCKLSCRIFEQIQGILEEDSRSYLTKK